jgi:hypothetical protein
VQHSSCHIKAKAEEKEARRSEKVRTQPATPLVLKSGKNRQTKGKQLLRGGPNDLALDTND